MPLALAVLLVLAALHGTAWAVVTAPWQGPDEAEHFTYAQHLAETGNGPDRNSGDGTWSTDEATALLQLNLAPIRLHPEGKPNWSSIDRTEAQIARLPDSASENGSGPNSAANYPPLYYAYEAVAYTVSPVRSPLGRLFVMRLATVALFVATVALAWLIAGELLSAPWARVLATGMVVLQPKLGFGAGIVNPDLMLVALGTGALYVAIRTVKGGATMRRAAVLAVLAGAAVFTHPRGLYLPPFAILALLVAAWRFRPGWRRVLGQGALAVGILGVCTAVTLAWTRAHASGLAYGSDNPVGGANVRQFLSYLWQFYLPKLSFMDPKVGPAEYGYRQVWIESGFGQFAGFTVNYKPSIYDAIQLVAGLGFVALYTTVVARFRTVVANLPVVVVSLSYVVLLLLLLHAVSYNNLRGSTDPVLTGRYLLPGIALYGAAIGWVAASLPRRIGIILGALLLAGSALLTLGGIGLSLEHFYG
jgi:hypothetical protein